MQLEQMYQEIILDHYRNPQGKGLREPFEVEVHHINPTCGDEVTLRVALADNPADAADPLVSLSHDGQGCSISQASQSVLFEQLDGVPLSEGMAAVDEFLNCCRPACTGTPRTRTSWAMRWRSAAWRSTRHVCRCALLGWMAWKDAVAQALAAGSPPGRRPHPAGVKEEDEHDCCGSRGGGSGGGVRGHARRGRPELGINVVDLGLVYDVHVEEDATVTLDMTLTSAACPSRMSSRTRPGLRWTASPRLPDQLGVDAAMGPREDHRRWSGDVAGPRASTCDQRPRP